MAPFDSSVGFPFPADARQTLGDGLHLAAQRVRLGRHASGATEVATMPQ